MLIQQSLCKTYPEYNYFVKFDYFNNQPLRILLKRESPIYFMFTYLYELGSKWKFQLLLLLGCCNQMRKCLNQKCIFKRQYSK